MMNHQPDNSPKPRLTTDGLSQGRPGSESISFTDLVSSISSGCKAAVEAILPTPEPLSAATLIQLIEHPTTGPQIALLSGYLLREGRIHGHVSQQTVVYLAHLLRDEALPLDARRGAAIALQGKLPHHMVVELIKEISSDTMGPLASLALRGNIGPQELSQLQALFSKTTDSEIKLRALLAVIDQSSEIFAAVSGSAQESWVAALAQIPKICEQIESPQIRQEVREGLTLSPTSFRWLTEPQRSAPFSYIGGNFIVFQMSIQNTDKNGEVLNDSVTELNQTPEQSIHSLIALLLPFTRAAEATCRRAALALDEHHLPASPEVFETPPSLVALKSNPSLMGNYNPHRRDEIIETLQLWDYPDLSRVASPEERSIGFLASEMTNPKLSRGQQQCFAELLLLAVSDGAVSREELDPAALSILTGTFPPFVKHLGSLLLQGTNRQLTALKLGVLLRDPDVGDYAAVALRGAQAENYHGIIATCLRSPDENIRYRATMATWGPNPEKLNQLIEKNARIPVWLRHSRFGRAVDSLFCSRPVLTIMARCGLLDLFNRVRGSHRCLMAHLHSLHLRNLPVGMIRNTIQSMPVAIQVLKGSNSDSFLGFINGTTEPILVRQFGQVDAQSSQISVHIPDFDLFGTVGAPTDEASIAFGGLLGDMLARLRSPPE